MDATPSIPEAESSQAAAARSMAQSTNGRVGGRPWKTQKTATRRSNLPAGVKQSFASRKAKEQRTASIKAIEAEMKDERRTEEERKSALIKERRERREEKKREEEMRAKMSAKKLQRMKKRLGRTKKVNG